MPRYDNSRLPIRDLPRPPRRKLDGWFCHTEVSVSIRTRPPTSADSSTQSATRSMMDDGRLTIAVSMPDCKVSSTTRSSYLNSNINKIIISHIKTMRPTLTLRDHRISAQTIRNRHISTQTFTTYIYLSASCSHCLHLQALSAHLYFIWSYRPRLHPIIFRLSKP